MKVYSNKLDWSDFDQIATSLDMKLWDADTGPIKSRGRFAGKREVRFLLRPTADTYRSAKPDTYCKAGVRRIWAVSWAGHYVFMRAVLEADHGAGIVTSRATYIGLRDFDVFAWRTGEDNIGSLAEPLTYNSMLAQAPDHAGWSDEEDLIAQARAVLVH